MRAHCAPVPCTHPVLIQGSLPSLPLGFAYSFSARVKGGKRAWECIPGPTGALSITHTTEPWQTTAGNSLRERNLEERMNPPRGELSTSLELLCFQEILPAAVSAWFSVTQHRVCRMCFWVSPFPWPGFADVLLHLGRFLHVLQGSPSIPELGLDSSSILWLCSTREC